jgi:hypothetical protein
MLALPLIFDPSVAEAVAAWKVVKSGRDLGFQNNMVDGVEIVLALQK